MRNDNPHSLRLTQSIKTTIGNENAQEFAEKFPLSKTVDYRRKFKWAKEVCEYLDNNYDNGIKMKIRRACTCESGISKINKMKAYLGKTNSLEEFAKLFNSKETYARIDIEDNSLLYIYPECYCSCVKRVDELISETWCYCTLGYAKSIFEKVFECEVTTELIESIKIGGKKCVVKITKV